MIDDDANVWILGSE